MSSFQGFVVFVICACVGMADETVHHELDAREKAIVLGIERMAAEGGEAVPHLRQLLVREPADPAKGPIRPVRAAIIKALAQIESREATRLLRQIVVGYLRRGSQSPYPISRPFEDSAYQFAIVEGLGALVRRADENSGKWFSDIAENRKHDDESRLYALMGQLRAQMCRVGLKEEPEKAVFLMKGLTSRGVIKPVRLECYEYPIGDNRWTVIRARDWALLDAAKCYLLSELGEKAIPSVAKQYKASLLGKGRRDRQYALAWVLNSLRKRHGHKSEDLRWVHPDRTQIESQKRKDIALVEKNFGIALESFQRRIDRIVSRPAQQRPTPGKKSDVPPE